jgi:hypothetical protein
VCEVDFALLPSLLHTAYGLALERREDIKPSLEVDFVETCGVAERHQLGLAGAYSQVGSI